MQGIKFYSIDENVGYGIAGKGYLKSLLNTQIPVTWAPLMGNKLSLWNFPLKVLSRCYYYLVKKLTGTKNLNSQYYYRIYTGRTRIDKDFEKIYNIPIDYGTAILHIVPEYYPYLKSLEPRKKIIGMTVWETTSIPGHWKDLLNSVDHLLVPTNWNKDIFIAGGVTTPIDVIPHVYMKKNIDGNADFLSNLVSKQDYMFYTIGSWTNRKAIRETIDAYLKAFSADDPVVLVIKTDLRDYTKSNSPLLKYFHKNTARIVKDIKSKFPNPGRIEVITKSLSDGEIESIHQRGNCYLSLCRSEGWGLGAFDAAGHGNPVIITGFGGQLEYLPEDLAYLVNYDLIPVYDRTDQQSYLPDQRWAKADIKHAVQLLRHVYDNQKEALNKGKRLQEYVKKNYSVSKVSGDMTQILKRILKGNKVGS